MVAATAVVGSKQQSKCGKPEKRNYGKNLSTSRVLLAMELGKMDSLGCEELVAVSVAQR